MKVIDLMPCREAGGGAEIRLTLALWQWHIYHRLFIYLFVHSFITTAQRENFSLSGPKILVAG